MSAREWMSRAACRAVDPELFFPPVEEGPLGVEQVEAAKAVCAGCPVRPECLSFALGALSYGVAGGLTAEERGGRGAVRRKVRPGGRPVAGTRDEVVEAGREAIRAGRPARVVAREFGVTERTACRWAAHVRCAGEDAAAATAATSGISHNNALAGSRAVEGHRG